MKKNILNQKDFIKTYNAAISVGLTKEQFANYLGIQLDSLRRRLLALNKETGIRFKPLKSGVSEIPQDLLEKFDGLVSAQDNNKSLLGHKRYVITSAQNATPVHIRFFNSLLTYCSHNSARLIVIPYRYKNPTSIWTKNNVT